MQKFILFCLILLLANPVYAGFIPGFNGEIDGNLILENKEQITNATDGKVCFEGQGGMNNEEICIDLESTANEALITSTTGLNLWDWGNVETEHGDNIVSYFGDGQEGAIMWDSLNTNDSLQIGVSVGDPAYSGYISIMEKADMGNANRDPAGTASNPTLRLYASDETLSNAYTEIYHNGTDGVIETGTGTLKLQPNAVGDVELFGDTDVGDTENGKSLKIWRRAAEGDDYLNIYISDINNANFYTPEDIEINPGRILYIERNPTPNSEVWFFHQAGSGDLCRIRQYNYITAAATYKYIQWQVDDTDDYFHLSREDTYIQGFKVDMPDIRLGNGETDAEDKTIYLANQGGYDTSIEFIETIPGAGDSPTLGSTYVFGAKLVYDGGDNIFKINTYNQTTEKNAVSIVRDSAYVGIGTTSPGQKLEVNGGVRLNTTDTKPTCDATTRGTFWVTQGGAGVQDNVEVCAKDASDVYAWRTIY